MSIDKSSLRFFDEFRGLAAIGVLSIHFFHLYDADTFFKFRVYQIFSISVQIFLGISGILITRSCLLKLDEEFHRFSWRTYFYARIARLGPQLFLYFIVLEILNLVSVLKFNECEFWGALFSFRPFCAETSVYTSHLWTLGVLIPFYLIEPLIISFFKGNLSRIITTQLLLCLIVTLWRQCDFYLQWYQSLAPRSSPFSRFDTRIDALLWGSIAYCTFLIKGKQYFTDRRARVALALGVPLFVSGFFLTYPWQLTIQGFLIPWFLMGALANFESNFGRWKSSRVLVSIGGAAYAIYIWQALVLKVLH